MNSFNRNLPNRTVPWKHEAKRKEEEGRLVHSSASSVPMYQTARRHIPEHRDLSTHHGTADPRVIRFRFRDCLLDVDYDVSTCKPHWEVTKRLFTSQM
jgi:hypothetical protein